nr:hypothetical protein [uncultured Cloacibacillus sp.]
MSTVKLDDADRRKESAVVIINADAADSSNPPQKTGSREAVAIRDCPAAMLLPKYRRPMKDMTAISGITMREAIRQPIRPARAVFRSLAAFIL